MATTEVTPEPSIIEKISWAKKTYEERKAYLLAHDLLGHLLQRFKDAARASHAAMVESGIAGECRACGEREGGSCCGKGLEEKYNGILLLINLLLNVSIPGERRDPSGCFFLGDQGCLLLARHVICVNYLCKKVTDHIPPEKIAILRHKEGIELEILFLLHERIKKIIAEPLH